MSTPNPMNPVPPQPCSVVTGILFSRKPCPETTAFTCIRCAKPVCLKHGVAQADKRLMCPSCDAYTRRDDDYDSHRSGYHRDSSPSTTVPAAPGAATGAAAGNALGQEDRAGLDADKGWHGEAPPDEGGGSDDSGGFDAS